MIINSSFHQKPESIYYNAALALAGAITEKVLSGINIKITLEKDDGKGSFVVFIRFLKTNGKTNF